MDNTTSEFTLPLNKYLIKKDEIKNVSFSKKEILELINELKDKTKALVEKEISYVHENNSIPNSQKNEIIGKEKEFSKTMSFLWLQIITPDEEEFIAGYVSNNFSEKDIPDEIKAINLRVEWGGLFNHPANNNMNLNINFGSSKNSSIPTYQNCDIPGIFMVSGRKKEEDTIRGIFDKVTKFLNKRKKINIGGLIHKKSFYNFLLFFVFIPLSAIFTYAIDNKLHFDRYTTNRLGLTAAYIYFFILFLATLKISFNGLQVLYPLNEMKDSQKLLFKFRNWITGISTIIFLGIASSFIYDVIKPYIT